MKNIILFALFVVVVLAMQTSAIKWNLKRDVSDVLRSVSETDDDHRVAEESRPKRSLHFNIRRDASAAAAGDHSADVDVRHKRRTYGYPY